MMRNFVKIFGVLGLACALCIGTSGKENVIQKEAIAADNPVITVYNTEKHGIFITFGSKEIYYNTSEAPFIDKNGRTLIPMANVGDLFSCDTIWDDTTAGIKDTNDTTFLRLYIDNDIAELNSEQVKMDTVPVVVDSAVYVPLRFIAEAFGYEVEYTEKDKYADITVTFNADNMGFKSTNTVTVHGSIENIFHESGGLGSAVPYEGEQPDLAANIINEYDVVITYPYGGEEAFPVYWDTLYDKAYIIRNSAMFTVTTDFPRFLDNLLESGQKEDYTVGAYEKELFRKYGWTLDYKINSIDDTLPAMSELGAFSPAEYYYLYNNELSKDIGLDMSSFAGNDITVDIYYIHESMPEKFYPMKTARGIVVKCDDEIIGAYISSGRHSVEASCSLNGKSFEEITGQTFDEFFTPLLKEEQNIVTNNPEEIIRRYFKALADKDEETAISCISKKHMFGDITSNILIGELYDRTLGLPLTNKTFMDSNEKSTDNIKAITNLEIEPFDNSDDTDTSKTYAVTFNIEYETEESISNGNQYWHCTVIYESDKTGWKIGGFGH